MEIRRWRVRCLVAKCHFRAKKPIRADYPTELKTLGDHLRKFRLDKGLSQSAVGKALRTNENCVSKWENNNKQPDVISAKKIINFMGYFPFADVYNTLGEQLYYARLITGKTQTQVASIIGSTGATLSRLELNLCKPRPRTFDKIREYINEAFESLANN